MGSIVTFRTLNKFIRLFGEQITKHYREHFQEKLGYIEISLRSSGFGIGCIDLRILYPSRDKKDLVQKPINIPIFQADEECIWWLDKFNLESEYWEEFDGWERE